MFWNRKNIGERARTIDRGMRTYGEPVSKEQMEQVYEKVKERYCPIVNGNCKANKCVSYTHFNRSPLLPKCKHLGVML